MTPKRRWHPFRCELPRSTRTRTAAHLLVGSWLIGLLAFACGGTTDQGLFDDSSTGGTTGTTGGDGGIGGTAGSNGGSGGNTGGGSTGGGGGGPSAGGASVTGLTPPTSETATVSSTTGSVPGLCELPIEPGDCTAAVFAWAFDAKAGRCVEFTYGGCEGNDNRFATLDECLHSCDPGGRTACEKQTDCTVDRGCCGYCGLSIEELQPVNIAYAGFTARECQLVDCAQCEPSGGIENIGARCEAGQCELYDVRESNLAECAVDSDCRLRAGLGCCESCDGSHPVAVSASHDELAEALCGDEDLACPPCEPIISEKFSAVCSERGQCLVAVTTE